MEQLPAPVTKTSKNSELATCGSLAAAVAPIVYVVGRYLGIPATVDRAGRLPCLSPMFHPNIRRNLLSINDEPIQSFIKPIMDTSLHGKMHPPGVYGFFIAPKCRVFIAFVP